MMMQRSISSGIKSCALLLAAMLAIALLAGCAADATGGGSTAAGTAGPQAGKEAEGQDDPFASVAPADIPDLITGITQLSDRVKSFKTAIEADDREEAEKLAGEMAAIWAAARVEAEGKEPERSGQLHKDLSALLVEVAQEEWDKTLLIDLDYSLYQGYRDLKQAVESGS